MIDTTEGFLFSVEFLVAINNEVGVVAKFIDDALALFGGLSVLEIDMK